MLPFALAESNSLEPKSSLVSNLERLTGVLERMHFPQKQAEPVQEVPQIRIMAQPAAKPVPQPLIIQATPSTIFAPSQPDVAALFQKVLEELKTKVAAMQKEAEKVERKKAQLEAQQKDLTVKVASENVRHRDELKALHQAHVQIQKEMDLVKREREDLDRVKLDKLVQRQ